MSEHIKQMNYVAEFEFSLPSMPSPELLKLIDHLFWTEYIYEANMSFNAYADLKYKITVRLPNNVVQTVASQINEIILRQES